MHVHISRTRTSALHNTFDTIALSTFVPSENQDVCNGTSKLSSHTANTVVDDMVDLADGQHLVQQALYLGDPALFNTTRDDCQWKRGSDRDTCPDKDIRLILYTAAPGSKRSVVSVHNMHIIC